MSYPYTPGFKVGGASRDAALAEAVRAVCLRDRVELLFATGVESTADEVAEALGASVLAVRPRLSEMVKLGRLEETGERRLNASGHSATVWRRRQSYGIATSQMPLL